MGFLDLVYQTQLTQFLKSGADKKYFFPLVYEEIFVINDETKTILNYLTIVEYPKSSLISMLSGPTADGGNNNHLSGITEQGFRS